LTIALEIGNLFNFVRPESGETSAAPSHGRRAPKFPQSFEETWSLMDQLPEHLARKIGRENAARVYRMGDER